MSEVPSNAPPVFEPSAELRAQAAALATINPTGVVVAGTRWVLSLGLNDTAIVGQQAVDRTTLLVHLSWPLAKAVGQMILDAVNQYEGGEGVVSLPNSFTTAQQERAAQLKQKP